MQPVPPIGDPANLQFEKAEFAGESRACVLCKNPIGNVFYTYAGHPICPTCSAQRSELKESDAITPQAFLYGLGAAIAGAIIYAIVSAIGFNWSLIAILVGWMVGKSIRAGAGGQGGLKLQILAVALTYLAITFGPLLYIVYKNGGIPLGAIPTLFSFAIRLPFLELQANFVSGLLNIVILAFGLVQAWRYTKGSPHELLGPFQAGTSHAGSGA